MGELKVYVCSVKIPAVGFIDKEWAVHACAQAQKSAFQGLSQVSNILGDGYLADNERQVLMKTEEFCKKHGAEYEIVDLRTMSFFDKLTLRLRA